MDALLSEIRTCTLCADRFASTETAHEPRPVLRISESARILVAGQAPGMKVHLSGKPFTDPSGDRLRDWMQVDEATFYDASRIGILPMGFCFPGYRKGSDLPPPAICAKTWRKRVLGHMPQIQLTLLIGGYAQKWHLSGFDHPKRNVSDTVAHWRDYAPGVIPLPHPSWRNTAWLKRNPWFEAELLPVLRTRIQEVLNG
ncbi:Uracil DNA glycosylase superfamily protein [Pelagimonas phthalicica]|uniref:Uracil DNA glycosylase superfamily protein n=1 Tax=Pelagimonas phthalicica TaxID=1037362 RepID=A0A238J860_9RHOB|nr:uracil-DNA glycosylase family protein [Pelagimonas phthalicica]TDS95420.1 uracil-DNA glycosylase [Pelagimonas phthalicica]SMX26056.1 Uracil DNA glycosylase superfamily protein [Pelagimonas phthalicica]